VAQICFLLIACFFLLAIPVSGSSTEEWKRFDLVEDQIVISYPGDWTAERIKHFVVFTPPDEQQAVSISSFVRDGVSLEEFGADRFSVESWSYKAVAEPERFDTANWRGLVQLSKGIPGTDTEGDARYILCAADPPIFVSVTAYCPAENFAKNKETYHRMFKSLTISPKK
jgi:hypothetical protein